MKKWFIACALAVGLMGQSGTASAIILTSTACIPGSVSGATACQGIYSGNDSPATVANFFGNATGWDFLLKLDSSSGTETATTGESLNVTGNNWTLSGVAASTDVMFILKGGPTFSAFLMAPGTTGGTFDMLSALKGNGRPGPGLSHWSVYTTMASVPLPASGLLLGFVLAVGGLVARRRQLA